MFLRDTRIMVNQILKRCSWYSQAFPMRRERWSVGDDPDELGTVVRSVRCSAFAMFTTIYELLYTRNPAVNRALCVLILACFFLWIRFLLC
jgi:hypothetical protein